MRGIVLRNCYSEILNPLAIQACEKKQSYAFVTERHIQAIWFEQKYFKDLKTSTGEAIHVISPGIWNLEAGPDFKKAHIFIGEKELKGDIEIHLSESGWEQHHHHNDPRYNEVILHLSLWKSNTPICTHEGHSIIRCALEPSLTISLQRIVNYIDLDLYPYKKFIGSGKCATTLFNSVPKQKIESFFKSAADWRLIQKRDFLSSRQSNQSLAFLEGIARCLGYKNNAEAFSQLFSLLQPIAYEPFEYLLSAALRATGFFESKFLERWEKSILYSSLQEFSFDMLPMIKLELNQIRPLNHPIRRIVYLIKLLKDPEVGNLYDRLMECWNRRDLDNIADVVPQYADPYWNYHYFFETNPLKEPISLIGSNLKREMLINVFLPFLFHEVSKREIPAEIEDFAQFYASFSPLKSGKSKYLIHRFFGDNPKGTVLNRAYTEQGAYQLHRDFCLRYEASCDGCPFVEKFLASWI